MKNNVLMLGLLVAMAGQLNAEEVKTAGDGKTYTLDLLSQMYENEVSKYVDEDDGEIIYTLFDDVTIAEGDKFMMDDGVTVQFDDKVAFTIKGEADFRLTKGSTFDSAFDDYDGVAPVGIYINNEKSQTTLQNCTFYYVGLRNMSSKGLKVDHCAFYYNNGAIGQAALSIGIDGAPFEITNSTFGYNKKAAIAGAANYRNPLLIENCEFICNGQANGNTPQLNLTVASNVVVRGCTIEGDPTKTMVGGIVVANLMGFTGELNTLIEENTISDCRFGMATYLWQKAVIRHNTLKDNCHETNPMNGGSGINVYDPYGQQYTYIEGNHIEGSLWGITLVGGKEANLGRTDVAPGSDGYNPGGNVFKNNGFDGVLYDLYNNSKNTVYAQGNIWNVSEQTEEQIENVVFHQHDDASLGTVIFMPAAQSTGMDEPAVHYSAFGIDNSDEVYDLQGRRVLKPRNNGLTIVKGRKYHTVKR